MFELVLVGSCQPETCLSSVARTLAFGAFFDTGRLSPDAEAQKLTCEAPSRLESTARNDWEVSVTTVEVFSSRKRIDGDVCEEARNGFGGLRSMD